MTSCTGRPLVSIVIPCFNQARYLDRAIESVRQQLYGPIETIVVNDGSTDDTVEVASRLGATVIAQSNQGLSAARNVGLRASHGEFVVFLDADDELLPDAVSIGVEALSQQPCASAAVGRCRLMDAEGRALPAAYDEVDPANLYHAWLSKNFVWTPGAAMFRRQALQDLGGFPVDLGAAADYAIYLELARSGGVLYHARDIVRYRQHPAAMSRDPGLMLRETLKVVQREKRIAPRALAPAIARGADAWRVWYGDQLVDRLRGDWRARRNRRSQVTTVLTLLWYCPALTFRHAARKLRCVLIAARESIAAALRTIPVRWRSRTVR